jgi:hypothetical protein
VLSVAATAAESKHPNARALRLCRQLFVALRYAERTVAAPSRRSRTSAFVLHPNPWSADTRCRVPTLLLRLRLQAIQAACEPDARSYVALAPDFRSKTMAAKNEKRTHQWKPASRSNRRCIRPDQISPDADPRAIRTVPGS